MAKKVTVRILNKRIDTYVKMIDAIYSTSIKESVRLAESISNYDKSKPFTWNRYPQTKAKIDEVVNSLYRNISTTITDATTKEWLAACLANDKIAKQFLGNPLFKSIQVGHYYQRNLEALEAFQIRKTNGLNLSDRIWNMSQQFKSELEMSLDLGLSEGKSASEISRDIRKYLNEPDKLYRRIKNSDNGNFYLSQNAKKYNPGNGMYRSSYKNAMRVTRTETNMAYRASDQARWDQLDFVVGYEIIRSNNVFACHVCESLKGKYPKWFKFYGWHPQCRCAAIPILATPEEFISAQKRILEGEENTTLTSRNEVKSLPQAFIVWAKTNSQKISASANTPYFLRDNFTKKDISSGLKYLHS